MKSLWTQVKAETAGMTPQDAILLWYALFVGLGVNGLALFGLLWPGCVTAYALCIAYVAAAGTSVLLLGGIWQQIYKKKQ
jgi:hypothetical protein